MAPYTALYRAWRPARFEDVVGQAHVTRTLRNALASGRLVHAYCFAGPRGTGKTSVARLLARAVNCLQPENGEPCNACANCLSISEGSAVDVQEIDGASNRGVDEIRDLREKVRFLPVRCRYKVYIIDEVHMLTPEAFNALLKTLEDPPSHVLFILATTEPQRIPATILSRCQRFEFRRLGAGEIAGRLLQVCQALGVEAEEEAVHLLARFADGALRDGLSLLDQCLALDPERLTVTGVTATLGLVPEEELLALAAGVAQGDPVAILDAVDRAAMAGRDMRQVVRDLVGVFRDALLHRFAARGRPPASLPAGPPGWPERLLTACEPLSDDDLVAALEELGRLEQDLRWAPRPRLGLEVALLRLARRRNAVMGTDGARPATGTAVPAGNDPAHSTAPPAAAASVTAAGAETPRPPRPVPPKRPPANGSGGSPTADAPLPTLADVQRLWPQVLAVVRSRRRPTAALLEPARPVAVEGSTLVLAFARTYEFHRNRMAEPKNLQVLEVALREILGHDLRVSCRRGDDDTPIGGHILPPLEAPRGNDEAEVARNLFGGEWIEEGDATS